ncbi:MAG: hypothetical protein JWP86_2579 [Phenylobacterium sp.]|nr:hypothetical protein [Phenylobacterium sp.]
MTDRSDFARRRTEADPRADRLEALLASGGDERIALDPATGLNRYGCGVRPAPGECAFSSSTASTLSPGAFAAAAARRDHLLSAGGARAADMDRIRQTLTALCGLPPAQAQEVILAPSGTDLHLIVADLARGGSLRPLTTVMADPAESGRGVPLALAGRRFGTGLPHGGRAVAGEPLPDLPPGSVMTIRVREDDGAARPAEAVDAEVEAACARAIRGGGPVLLAVLDVSKTGLSAPSLACAARLKAAHGEALTVLVDACQFRLRGESVARRLALGFLVAVTGSKFYGGPAFSGALFVPAGCAERLRAQPLSPGLADYCARTDWPAGYAARTLLPDASNLGLLLRWEAALHEMWAFHALPAAEVAGFVGEFAAAVADQLASCPQLEPIAPAAPSQAAGGWDSIPTIFPFLVRGPAGVLGSAAVQALYEQLRSRDADPVRLGQPVAIGRRRGEAVSALRLALGARDVVEALRGGRAAVIERARRALTITARAAGA